MLGNIGKSTYSNISDFKSLKDFTDYLYGNSNGYIYSCVKYKHNDGREIFSSRGINISRIKSDLSNTIFSDIINGESYDRYMTLNTFWYKRENGSPILACKVENAKRLNAFYVDIDCYKMGMSQESVIYELTENLSSYDIPHWTFLIKSGRGVYVIWKLRNEDGYIDEVKKKWKIIEDYLCSQLVSLGADSNATDIARVLRVPFSYNSKSNSMVEIVDFFDVDYSIYDIMAEYCSEQLVKCYHPTKKKSTTKEKKLSPKMMKCADGIAKKLGVSSPCSENADYYSVWKFINDNKNLINAKSRYTATTLPSYIARDCAKNADDIERLMALRHGKENGCREVALFLFRTMLLRATEDTAYALERTLELNSTFASPLDVKVVVEATESAERYYKTRYNFSRKKIAEMLNINDSECESLCFLCGANCVRNRQNANRKYYLSTLEKENKTTKESKINERRIRIKKMINDGFCCDAICNELGISKATLYRDMQVLNITFKSDDIEAVCENENTEAECNVNCDWGEKKAVFGLSHFLRYTVNKRNFVPYLFAPKRNLFMFLLLIFRPPP